MTRDLVNIDRDRDGNLPAHAWPGGYPLYYLDTEGNILCAQCANTQLADEYEHFRPVAWGIHYEGEPLDCDQCSEDIDSAYGPVPTETH